jgi:apolipoprotein N-acyltransferase
VSALVLAVGCGLLSGGIHALTLREPSALPLAWVALVPLLLVVERQATRLVFAGTLAYSIALFEIDVTSWSAPAGARYFHMDPVDAWLAFASGIGGGSIVYGMLLATAFWLRRRTGRTPSVVWYGALWAVWEWLRAWTPPFLPASILGTSQRGALPVLQLASLVGIGGVTALVVAGNVAIAGVWSRPRRWTRLAVVGALVLAVVVWGALRLERTTSPGPRVLLVDGAASEMAESTLDRYRRGIGRRRARRSSSGPSRHSWSISRGSAAEALSVSSDARTLIATAASERRLATATSSTSIQCISFGRDTVR